MVGRVISGLAKLPAPLLLAPAAAWYLAFFVVPIGFIAVFSFLTSADFGGISYQTSLENYQRLAQSTVFLKVFGNTIWMAAGGTVLCMVIAFPLAYFLATRAGRWKNLLLVLLIVPFWTSSLTRTYAWLILLGDHGPLAALLNQAHLINGDLNFLYTYNAILLGVTYNYLPLMIFPLYVSLERLDKRLLEAAKDLGAGRWRTFRRVTLPMTMPGIVIGCLLVFIPLMGEYLVPSILGGARSFILGNLNGGEFISSHDGAFGSALAMAVIVILLVLIAIYFRAARRLTSAELAL